MIDFLLVALYYFSLFMIVSGIWMIIASILSKDKSMGMGAVIGVVSILIGLLLYAITYTPNSNNKIEIKSENSQHVPTVIPSNTQ